MLRARQPSRPLRGYVSAIPPGGRISQTITQALPSGTTTGAHHISLIADQPQQVPESNETNNVVKKWFTVN